MEYIKEDQILLYEELCAKPLREDEITKATILFRENIKLAYHVVLKFGVPKDPALDKEDLLQAAYYGLWEACLGYDESTGNEFSTYAVVMIRGRVLRELRDNNPVHEPRWFKDIRSTLNRYGYSLPLSDEEIERVLSEDKFTRDQLDKYVDIHVVSFDTPIKEDSENTFESLIPGIPDYVLGDYLSDEELEEAINKILVYAPPKYKDMMEEYLYSIAAREKIDQISLGKKYNISQSQVCRSIKYLNAALRKNEDKVREIFGY